MAGPVEAAIRDKLRSGVTLWLLARGKPFVLQYDSAGLVLLQGESGARIRVTWNCLEGVPAFMRGNGWLSLGGSRSAAGDPGTLDEYFKRHIKRDVARWVGRVLSEAGVVDVQLGRPVQVRLRAGF